MNTSWEHLLLCCQERNNLHKEPGGLRISIQSIFALYLQTGLLGTLEEKKSLRFLSTAYERRVWSNRDWEFPWSVTLFQAQQSKALPRQFRATVFRLLWKTVRENLRILLNSKIQAVNLIVRTDGVGDPAAGYTEILSWSPGSVSEGSGKAWEGFLGPLCAPGVQTPGTALPMNHLQFQAGTDHQEVTAEHRAAAGFAQQGQLW